MDGYKGYWVLSADGRGMAGYDLEAVHLHLVWCHREGNHDLTVTSPEGVEMTEKEFYVLYRAERAKGNA